MPRQDLIAIRRGTAAQWTSANPTLSSGEQGFETDTNKLKIGDGSTAWNSLAYITGGGAVQVFADYTDTTAMIADQSNQDNQAVYAVADASDDANITFANGETKLQAFYRYNGVATGSIDDYTLISAPYGNHTGGNPQNWTKINVDTTDDLQDIIANCSEYTEINLLPGIHEYADTVDTNQSIIYITKSNIRIKFHPQAVLKLADNTVDMLDEVEINTNYFQQTGLNDIEARATGGGTPTENLVDALITINGTGTPNTFLVTEFQRHEATPLTTDGTTNNIVAGEWFEIGAGVEIRFLSATGHTNGDVWRIMTSGEAIYPIRIGDGFQTDYIKNITIQDAVIDGNLTNNNRVHIGVAETGGGIGVFGRVDTVEINKAKIFDTERPIFVAGRHTGTFNNDGTTTGGESFDVRNVLIDGAYCHDNESAILWGHPSYRGYQYNITLRNSVVTNPYLGKHAIEPNHRLIGFVIENCYLESEDEAIHMWRSPQDGIIRGNNMFPNTIMDNAPVSWYRSGSVNVTVDNTDKILSNPNNASLKLAQRDYFPLAVSNEDEDLTTGFSKITFRMPYATTLKAVRANVGTAPTGSTLIVDINQNGTSILSTKLSIDAGEKTSTTAAVPAVISNVNLLDDAEITVDIDQIGSTVAGKGLKIVLIGTKP